MAGELLSLLGHAVVDAVVIVVKSKSGKKWKVKRRTCSGLYGWGMFFLYKYVWHM